VYDGTNFCRDVCTIWYQYTVTPQHVQNPDQDAREVEAPTSQQSDKALKEAELQKTEIYEIPT